MIFRPGSARSGASVTDTVLLTLRHHLGRAMKSLLHRDHFAAGEAFFPSAVPAQPDKLRRSLDGGPHRIELFQPARMPIDKHR